MPEYGTAWRTPNDALVDVVAVPVNGDVIAVLACKPVFRIDRDARLEGLAVLHRSVQASELRHREIRNSHVRVAWARERLWRQPYALSATLHPRISHGPALVVLLTDVALTYLRMIYMIGFGSCFIH